MRWKGLKWFVLSVFVFTIVCLPASTVKAEYEEEEEEYSRYWEKDDDSGDSIKEKDGFVYYIYKNKVIVIDIILELLEDDKEVTIPESIDGYPVVEFSGYLPTEVENLYLPKTLKYWDIEGTYTPDDSDHLKNIIVDKDNPKFSSKNGILYNKKKTALVQCPSTRKSVTIPKSVRTIKNSAFTGVHLRKIVIPDTVKTIEEFAFSGCTKLKSVKLSKNLKVLEQRAFEECFNLKTIKIPDSVEKIGELVFFLCRNLQSVEIGENLKEIDEEVFWGCKKLKKITVKTEKLNGFPFPTTRDIGKKKNVLIIAKKDSYVYRTAKKKGFKVRAF